MNAHVSFCYACVSLQRNPYTASHVVNISFVMVVSKFIYEMKELMIVKDFSYFDVRNILLGKNPDTKGISERTVWRFLTSNNIRKRSNLSKEEFQKINFLKASKV